jgi:phosphopentomutase
LPFCDLLLMMAHFVNELKGLSAVRLTQQLEVHYKTAFVRLQKLREVLKTYQQRNELRGHVEIDGAYFGGYVRPRNRRPARADRRRLPHRTGKRQCVVIMRERAGRSRPFIMSEAEAAAIGHQIIEPGSEVYTDEGNHWIRFAARYVLHMVNHSERYSDGDKCTNWAESYFARLRRCELGIHHHIAGPHLAEYANEISWREDRRRYSNKENFDLLAHEATHHPVSRKWKGYWQRRKAA